MYSANWFLEKFKEEKYTNVAKEAKKFRDDYIKKYDIEGLSEILNKESTVSTFIEYDGNETNFDSITRLKKEGNLYFGLADNSSPISAINLCRLKETGKIMYGKKKELSEEDAEKMSKRIIKALIRIQEEAKNIKQEQWETYDEFFNNVQSYFSNEGRGCANTFFTDGRFKYWVFKYLNILFPEKFTSFYNNKWVALVEKALNIEQEQNYYKRLFNINKSMNSVAKETGLDKAVIYRIICDDLLPEIDAQKNNKKIKEALVLVNNKTVKKESDLENIKKDKCPLNQILYGPPGTGKTYNSVIKAVEICLGETAVNNKKYDEILKDFNKLKQEGRIAFTTFHQSYGYEEFIEGIKPEIIEGRVEYNIKQGVFKSFCDNVKVTTQINQKGKYKFDKNARIWKVSLGGTGKNPIRDDCLKNNHIRIGWDSYGKDINEETDFSNEGGKVVLNAFINRMSIGDLVLSCFSERCIDAIGVVTGEYEWNDEYKSHKRVRKVEWIIKNIEEDIVAINNNTVMTLASVYSLSAISISDIVNIINKYQEEPEKDEAHEEQKYVFIIDEINRGNVSKIFGELITLIEESKRVGNYEAMEITLPYSGKSFGVPNNVYILGTMNTADRSLVQLDAALRRRFRFIEMMPNDKVLNDKINVDGVNLKELLKAINERITVLIDREHQIGHSYFTKVNNIQDLKEAFENEIIPLLQEYFYEDYEGIKIVLGKKFIKDEEKTVGGITKKIYTIEVTDKKEDFIAIYQNQEKTTENNIQEENINE